MDNNIDKVKSVLITLAEANIGQKITLIGWLVATIIPCIRKILVKTL